MINVPMNTKANGGDFKKVFETEFKPALEAFKPEIIFVSAGFDAHVNDPLADLALIEEDYVWMTEFTKKIAEKYAEHRIISSLEGGYHLPSLAQSAWAHIDTLSKNG
jgi:acetoin utilization deacetylase AcuC-like enzyme